MTKGRVLIIEDDLIMGESLADRVALEGYDWTWMRQAEEALPFLEENPVSLILSDMRLPGMSGRALLAHLKNRFTTPPPMVLITGYGSIDEAVEALKEGACDYITKPFDLNALMDKIAALCPGAGLECHGLRPLGISPAMRQFEALLPKVAQRAMTVLLTGESGVGKECVARRLHQLACPSPENAPFLAINCAALPDSLLENELFGHEKGAFTGAHRHKSGLFMAAGEGTLFLDEIGEISLGMQAKLLRAVQEREVMPLGSQSPCRFSARLIFATNRDLRHEVEQGRFREDLFYRIHVIHLRIPPLRERKEDIAWLAQGFVAELSARHGGPRWVLGPETLKALNEYPWPGNVRELRHAIERACILGNTPLLAPSALFDGRMTAALPDSTPALSDQDYALSEYLRRCESDFIKNALKAHEGKVMQTAQALGISRKSLWEKMKRYGFHVAIDSVHD